MVPTGEKVEKDRTNNKERMEEEKRLENMLIRRVFEGLVKNTQVKPA